MSSKPIIVTLDDRGPLVNIAAWITMVVMCLTTFVKVGSRLDLTHQLRKDDLFMVMAMMTAIGQTIAVSMQVAHGLGRHTSTLSSSQIADYDQAEYASQILYISATSLAKLAVLQFLTTLARKNLGRLATKAVMAAALVWSLVAILSIAFQCSLPHPWAITSVQCFDQRVFWIVIGTSNVVLDVATAVLPVNLLFDLQVPWKSKIIIMSAFGARIITIPCIITRLIYISVAAQSRDHTFDDFNTVITTQVEMNLSIIVACIPFLKPFMDSLQTGLLSSEVRTLTPGYALGSQWQKVQGAMSNEDSAGSKARTKAHESSHQVAYTAGESRSRDLESRSSDRSDKIIIQTNKGLSTSSGRYDIGY